MLLKSLCSDTSISFSSSNPLSQLAQKVKGFKCNNAGQMYILKKSSKFCFNLFPVDIFPEDILSPVVMGWDVIDISDVSK